MHTKPSTLIVKCMIMGQGFMPFVMAIIASSLNNFTYLVFKEADFSFYSACFFSCFCASSKIQCLKTFYEFFFDTIY